MTTGKVVLVTLIAGTLGAGLAMLSRQWQGEGVGLDLVLGIGDSQGDRLEELPELSLPDLTGAEVHSSAWAGKVLVLNYWATWCPPCLREIPLLAQARERYAGAGLEVVGIAIDQREDVAAFLDEHPLSYPILLGDTDAIELSRRLGNRMQGLPFTVIFDRTGRRVHAQVGELTQESLDRQLAPLVADALKSQTAGN